MSIPSPQPIPTFVDVDNLVLVTMATNGSVLGMDLVAQITTNTDDSVIATKTVTIIDPGSLSTKAKMSFQLSPDVDGVPVPAVGGGYKYWIYVTNAGSRAVIAWGALQVKKRIKT